MGEPLADPIFNAEIAWGDFRIREISYGAARRNAERIYSLIKEITEKHPDVDWQTIEASQATRMIINSIPVLVESCADILENVVEEATGMTSEGIQQLGLSQYLQLTAVVLAHQKPAIEAFFQLRDRMGEMFGRNRSQGAAQKGKRG